MNIIINGFHDRYQFRAIERISKVFGIKYIATVYSQKTYPLPSRVKVDYFEYEEVLYHGDYGLDLSALAPLDRGLVEQMQASEAVVLQMMDRMEKYRSYSYENRRDIYLRHLRVWNDIIKRKKINLYIGSNVPHIPYSFVAYELCRLHGIPTIIMKQSKVKDNILLFEDWKNPAPAIGGLYKKFLAQKNVKLSDGFDTHFLSHVDRKDTTPAYMKKKPLSKKLRWWLGSVVVERRWSRRLRFGMGYFYAGIRSAVSTRMLMHYYESIAQRIDYKKKYIYLPLHLQPEMTTSPCAGVFVQQDLMVKLLSKALPRGYLLYVKENPKQTSLMRSRKFYDELKKLRNVRIVSRRVDTYRLIENCQAVATATGTAGWEALLRGKPVMMFGFDFYQYAPGVYRVSTVGDARAAVESIRSSKRHPSKKQMKAFVKAVEEVSVPGNINPNWRRVSSLDPMENETNLTKAISDHMTKLGFKRV